MHLNWRRGLFRSLVVLAVAGAGYAGSQWQTWQNRLEADCWSRIAKWPDGRTLSVFDLFEEVNTSRATDANKERGIWPAESILSRNQWVVSTRQKLIECEAGGPVVSEMTRRANAVWNNLRNSLLGVAIPPLAILIMVWIARGFRPSEA